jgi:pilus assembly protein CpaB
MNSRQRRGLLLLITAGLLAVVTFGMVGSYVSSVRAEVGNTVTVYRLNKDLPAFSPVVAADVTAIDVPSKWVGPGAFTDKSFVGRQTSVALKADSYVSAEELIPPEDFAQGEREIAINVDAQAGVAGRIEPGDYVNVNVTFDSSGTSTATAAAAPDVKEALVLIRRARIVAIGLQHHSQGTQGDTQTLVPVTFALSEQDSLKLLYAESFAKSVRLSKVLPQDTLPPAGYQPFTNGDIAGPSGAQK